MAARLVRKGKVSTEKLIEKKSPRKKVSKKDSGMTFVLRPVFSEKKSIFYKLAKWFEKAQLWPATLSIFAMVCVLSLLLWPRTQIKGWNNAISFHFERVSSDVSSEKMAYWSGLLAKNPKFVNWIDAKDNHVPGDFVPLIPKSFDCTTYIETAMALSLSETPAHFVDNLLRIRYHNGQTAFIERNHFPEADWIPNNIRSGILQDLTAAVSLKLGIENPLYVTKNIYKQKWLEETLMKSKEMGRLPASWTGVLQAMPERVPARVDYVPLDKAVAAAEFIPNGSIINIVHSNNTNKANLISHQGILVHKRNGYYFRHARKDHGIKDVPWANYVAGLKEHSWKVVGININSMQ